MPEDSLIPPTPPSTPPPTPPPATPLATPPVAPPVVGPTSTGMAPNVAAGVAVLFSFVSGIIFLVIEKRSLFVRFWAMQSTIYGLIWLVVRIAFVVLIVLFSSSKALLSLVATLAMVVNLLFFAGAVIMMYYAFTGKEWEFPGLGKIAREQLVKFPPKP